MSKQNLILIVILTCGFLLAIACGVCIVGGVGAYLWLAPASEQVSFVTVEPLLPTEAPPTPLFATPTAVNSSIEPVNPLQPAPLQPNEDIALAAALETLRVFEETIVPINDPIDLARRLEGRPNLPRSLEAPVKMYRIGDRESFWVTNSDTNENFEVEASLRYMTDHVYFWIQDGVHYNERDLKELVETFENEIYPRNREFFGSEWTPGVDADPHLFILYARGLGGSVAGYYSSADEYLPVVREKTNGHEMFLLSADHVDLGEEYAYGVLAHEFQHMIHWYRDRNEETWMNEGFSDLAMFLNNYSIGGADRAYISDPDLQLTDWPSTPTNRTEHYGASFLFMTYFLDRFGERATQMLVADEANGMVSIDQVLASLGAVDAITNTPIRADDVFADWVIASFLQDSRVADGRYTYHNYSGAPSPAPTETIGDCPTPSEQRDVSQYGVDYIRIRCRGDYILRFEAPELINALPVNPKSGAYAFYSNRGDESDITLTREFDFSANTAPLTLTYWTWYDLEEDYDYLYLLASEDGETWQILTTPSGTAEDPVGNSYGWAYNGLSGSGPRWIEEKVDLSQFAGKKVQLRFEYITDAAVNGEGFLLDDVSVPEIGYFTDFENDDGGWQGNGFVRIQNVLPQMFRLALIWLGDDVEVQKLEFLPGSALEIPLSLDRRRNEVVLVVSGITRFTRQKAPYQFAILAK